MFVRLGPWNLFGFNPVVFLPWYEWLGQMFSPYQLNPFNVNPLRTILTDAIDFDCVRTCQQIRLYISATNVRINCLRIFTGKELSVDVLLRDLGRERTSRWLDEHLNDLGRVSTLELPACFERAT